MQDKNKNYEEGVGRGTKSRAGKEDLIGRRECRLRS
jgi:hypothetical protein